MGADAPVLGPPPSWVSQSIERAEPREDAAAVQILFSDTQVKFFDRAVESYSASSVRVQNSQGLAALGTMSFSWKPDTDVLTIHRIAVLRGDESIDVLGDGTDLEILRREGGLEYAALTGDLTAVIQVPGLQVGDIVETAFTLRRVDPVVADRPENDFVWPATPMRKVRFRVLWPQKMPMRWKASDALPQLEQKLVDGFWTVSFTLDDMNPLPQPTGAPARFAALRRFEMTTFRDWREVSRRLAPLYQDASKLPESSPLHAEIRRIKSASDDPKIRAAAALKLVQDQVRYVFLGMNDGGLVPATADITWQRRYGDCKGKTALLLALLRELGVDAEPAAVNLQLGDGLDTRLPGVAAFDHVFVRANIDGKTYWLDGTRTGDRQLDTIAVPLYDWALPLVAKGSELVRLEPTPPPQPTVAHVVHIDASAGLSVPASFQADAVYRGDMATNLKAVLDNVASVRRNEVLRDYWQGWLESSEAKSVSTDFDENTGELQLKAQGTMRMNWDNGRYEVPHVVLGYRADFSRPPGTDTNAPYAVAFPLFTTVAQTIVLPEQSEPFTISGETFEQTVAGTEYRRRASIQGNVFNAEASVRAVAREFPASEAKEAERALREMVKRGLYVNKPALYRYTDAELAETKLDSAAAYVDRGGELMGQNRMDLAIREFDRAIELDPKDADGYAYRGLAYIYIRDFESARRDLDMALDLRPDSFVALRNRGVLALAERDARYAITMLSEALEKKEDSLTLERRASAYLAVGDRERALADANAARRLSPTWTPPYELAADILVEEGAVEQARELAVEVIKAAGDTAIAHSTAMRIYLLTEDEELARMQADEVIKRGGDAAAYAIRAGLQSDPEAQKTDLNKALELDPRSSDALSALAWYQMQMGDYAGALSTIEKLEDVVIEVDNLMLQYRGIAYFMIEQAELERGREVFDEARRMTTSAYDLHNMCALKAKLAFEAERLPLASEAAADCAAALAIDPTCIECLETRSRLYLRLDRFEEALRDFESLISQSATQNAGWIFGRGIAKRRLGKQEEGDADIAAARALSSRVDKQYAAFGLAP